MSLLNQMLNDLDRRRADEAGAAALHREIRPLPPAPAGALVRPLWLFVVLLALAAVFAGWWFFAGAGRALPVAPPPQPGLAALPELTLSVPALPAELASKPAPAAQSQPVAAVPAPVSAAALMPPSRQSDGSLRLSDELSLPPALASSRPAESIPGKDGSIDKQALEPNLREQAERLYRSAVTQLAQGHEQDGVNTLRAVLRDDPDHLAARQLLIKLNLDRRAFEPAQAELEEGLRRLPRQTAWAMLLSRLRVERGDPAGGLAVLERHEAYAGPAADYQGAMAAMLQRLNRNDEAEARFARAAQAEPANGRWWLGLGMAREAQGKSAEAREAFRAALGASGLSPELRTFAETKAK